VDDLEHRRAFADRVVQSDPVLAGQDLDARRQVARGLDLGQEVDAVRQHADFRTAAVNAKVVAREVRHVGDVALGGVGLAGYGPRGGPDGGDLRRPAQGLDLHERQAGANRSVLRVGAGHAAAESRDPAQQAGRDLGPDVDQDPAGGAGPHRGAQAWHGLDDRIAALPPYLEQQVRRDLALLGRARGLFLHQGLDLLQGRIADARLLGRCRGAQGHARQDRC
jgi:hypothetical protein